MKSKVYLLVPLLLLALAGAGCTGSSTSNNALTDPHAGHMMGMGNQAMGEMTTLAGNRVELENETSLKPGTVTFAFKLRGADGSEYGPFSVHVFRMQMLKLRHIITYNEQV